ncbi:MAG TPA: thymidine phosphorylase [Burkholderiaceae bacterium]|nr:thymidine phosphorylase [Burkholderiaceae bacterium]
MTFLPQETIRRKRLGERLGADVLAAFVQGIKRRKVSDAQAAAFAMAVCWRGMTTDESVALTLAMRDSGRLLDWRRLPGPVVDKHSTGGVGDTVSLMLGPMLAACGCFVPMISGRGLGHTGGTLDKLEAIPGYTVRPAMAQLRRVVREAGVAIVGAGPGLAPADARLYTVRGLTATVESVPLITASILSKKLAAGLQALVLDVKYGSGAFMPGIAKALVLARSLVDVGCGAGLPTQALLTDMNEPLAPCAGNAIEVQAALDYLAGRCRPARLHEVVLALGGGLLVQAGRAADDAEARQRLLQALDGGEAAERLARMVAGLGGPADLLDQPGRHLAAAPVRQPVPWPDAARDYGLTHVQAIDTRALGLVVLQLGGGRLRGGDPIDPSVGLSGLAPLGAVADAAAPLAWVHAASADAAQAAVAAVQAAYRFADTAPRPRPVVAGRVAPGVSPELAEDPHAAAAEGPVT